MSYVPFRINVLVHIDGILVFSHNPREHGERVLKVLVEAEKYEFQVTKISFLGLVTEKECFAQTQQKSWQFDRKPKLLLNAPQGGIVA